MEKGLSQRVKISTLKADNKNARKHSQKNINEIKRSLVELGQHAPLVVQKQTKKVLVGNGRLEAMRALGWDEAWVYFVEDDEETAIKRALADNRTAELAEWNDSVLRDLLSGLDDISVPGWSGEEISEILSEEATFVTIEDILSEESIGDAIPSPVWIVARADIKDQPKLEQVVSLLRENEIDVKASYEFENYQKR